MPDAQIVEPPTDFVKVDQRQTDANESNLSDGQILHRHHRPQQIERCEPGLISFADSLFVFAHIGWANRVKCHVQIPLAGNLSDIALDSIRLLNCSTLEAEGARGRQQPNRPANFVRHIACVRVRGMRQIRPLPRARGVRMVRANGWAGAALDRGACPAPIQFYGFDGWHEQAVCHR